MFLHKIRNLVWLLVACPVLGLAAGDAFHISAVNSNGLISWTNAFIRGVCTVEAASQLNGSNGQTLWYPQQNYYTTNAAGAGGLSFSAGNNFFRQQFTTRKNYDSRFIVGTIYE